MLGLLFTEFTKVVVKAYRALVSDPNHRGHATLLTGVVSMLSDELLKDLPNMELLTLLDGVVHGLIYFLGVSLNLLLDYLVYLLGNLLFLFVIHFSESFHLFAFAGALSFTFAVAFAAALGLLSVVMVSMLSFFPLATSLKVLQRIVEASVVNDFLVALELRLGIIGCLSLLV
jgi:hypothetical protein